MKLAAVLTMLAAFFTGVSIGAYAEWYYRTRYLEPPQVRRDQLRVVAV